MTCLNHQRTVEVTFFFLICYRSHLFRLAAPSTAAIQVRLVGFTENTREPRAGMAQRWPQSHIVIVMCRIVSTIKLLAGFCQSIRYKLPLRRCHLLEHSFQSIVRSQRCHHISHSCWQAMRQTTNTEAINVTNCQEFKVWMSNHHVISFCPHDCKLLASSFRKWLQIPNARRITSDKHAASYYTFWISLQVDLSQ